jgi:hypothetical protein
MLIYCTDFVPITIRWLYYFKPIEFDGFKIKSIKIVSKLFIILEKQSYYRKQSKGVNKNSGFNRQFDKED